MHAKRPLFELDDRKATEASCVLLRLASNRMTYLRLVKLMYLADRQSLCERGMPILGDAYFSMKNGPVMSRLLDLAKGEVQSPVWSEHVERVDFVLSMRKDSGPYWLSNAERDILRATHEKFLKLDDWDLCDWTHDNCKEWTDPRKLGKKRVPIEADALLRAVGLTKTEIEEIRIEAEARRHMVALLQHAPTGLS